MRRIFVSYRVKEAAMSYRTPPLQMYPYPFAPVVMNPQDEPLPLSQVPVEPGIRYFSALIRAAQTTPDGDWGATDYRAALATGASGAVCGTKCQNMPWLYSSACTLGGAQINGCSGTFYRADSQFPALTATQEGRDLLLYPWAKR